jgi:hypothetical protein
LHAPCHLALSILLGCALPGAAMAGTVQWLGELPPEPQRVIVERTTGPVTHQGVSALAWPVEPRAREQAQQALASLATELHDCQARWEAFDVEQDIAWRLGQAVDAVVVLPDEPAREQLWQALLLQGAAVHWAWSPPERERLQEAEPYLLELEGQRLYAPWADAVALFPQREPARADLPDQASFQAFERQREHLLSLHRAQLTAVGLAEGAALVVDGQATAPGARSSLVAGRHWVHVERSGELAAPAVLLLGPGEQRELVGLISLEDLDKASERLLAGNLLDVPQPVKDRVEALRSVAGDDPFYLATWPGRGNPQAYELTGDDPWKLGEYDRDTALLVDVSLGAGLMGSTAFVESDGATAHAAAATVLQLGGQFAWRRWAVLTELAVHDTTSRAGIEYGDVATTTNVVASSFARFTVAPGFYVLRLRPRRTSFVVAAPIGLLSPAHSGIGAQAWFGIPVGRTTWLRLGFDFFKGNELPKWELIDEVNDPLTTLSLRVGVAQKLH